MLLVLAIGCAVGGPVWAEDDDGGYGSRVFEGEPASGQPLDSVPEDSRTLEAMPAESMPLDGPVEGRVTDSEAADGLGLDPGPREMIPEDDDAAAGGGLKEAEPADHGDGVEPGPRVMERVTKEPGY